MADIHGALRTMGRPVLQIKLIDPRTAAMRYIAFLVTAIVVSTAINLVFDNSAQGPWPKWGTLIGASIGWITSFLWRLKTRP